MIKHEVLTNQFNDYLSTLCGCYVASNIFPRYAKTSYHHVGYFRLENTRIAIPSWVISKMDPTWIFFTSMTTTFWPYVVVILFERSTFGALKSIYHHIVNSRLENACISALSWVISKKGPSRFACLSSFTTTTFWRHVVDTVTWLFK